MNHKRTWCQLGLVVFVTLFPLLALGCESTKQTDRPAFFSQDRTGTVNWLLKKPYETP